MDTHRLVTLWPHHLRKLSTVRRRVQDFIIGVDVIWTNYNGSLGGTHECAIKDAQLKGVVKVMVVVQQAINVLLRTVKCHRVAHSVAM